MPKTPWIGLLALIALFLLPYVPDWVFEGPRTIKHRPRRHICGECGAAWSRGHVCEPDEPERVLPTTRERPVEPEPVRPARVGAIRAAGSGAARPVPGRRERVVGELRRLDR